MGAVLLHRARFVLGSSAAIVVACSSGPISLGDHRVLLGAPDSGGGPDTGGGGARPTDAANASDVVPTPGGLVGITSSCTNQISMGLLRPRASRAADVQICRLSNAVFWRSGMSVLCAGKSTPTCNSTTDPQFQPRTTAKDSLGESLDAALLPYVEVSAPSMAFDYTTAGLAMGTVTAVIYGDRLEYGIIGTVGVQDVIGEASVAMASSLDINPDPETGGTSTGVTYIAFTGAGTVVTKNEDHDEAVRLGQAAAAALIQAGR
jgi:hypothetical protein